MARSNLFVFTALLFIFAIAFIGIGAAFFMDVKRYSHISHETRVYIPIFLMLTGGICALCTSLLALFTGLLRHDLLFGTTVVFLTLAVVCSGNCSGFAAVYLYQAGPVINSSLAGDIRKYTSQYADFDNELVGFQQHFSCCGVHESRDWAQAPFFRNHSASGNASLPRSCFSAAGIVFQQGCYSPVFHWFATRLGAQIAVSALVALVLLVELLYLVDRMSKRALHGYRLLVNDERDNT